MSLGIFDNFDKLLKWIGEKAAPILTLCETDLQQRKKAPVNGIQRQARLWADLRRRSQKFAHFHAAAKVSPLGFRWRRTRWCFILLLRFGTFCLPSKLRTRFPLRAHFHPQNAFIQLLPDFLDLSFACS